MALEILGLGIGCSCVLSWSYLVVGMGVGLWVGASYVLNWSLSDVDIYQELVSQNM